MSGGHSRSELKKGQHINLYVYDVGWIKTGFSFYKYIIIYML